MSYHIPLPDNPWALGKDGWPQKIAVGSRSISWRRSLACWVAPWCMLCVCACCGGREEEEHGVRGFAPEFWG
jgi:hypothetical protein